MVRSVSSSILVEKERRASRNVRLSVIMPCYKGEQFIDNSIHTVERVLSNFGDDFEIIVVIDGFVDKSYEIAKNLEGIYDNLKVIGYKENRGKGYAINYALKSVVGEYVALLDSDLDYSPEIINNFVKISISEDADIVIGNRRAKGSTIRYPKFRKILSLCYNIYVNTLFPELKLRDTQAGIKLFKKSVLESLFKYLKVYNVRYSQIYNRYAFDVCLLVSARKLGYKIVEAPCIFIQNHTEIRNINLLKTMFDMGMDVLRLKLNCIRNGKLR